MERGTNASNPRQGQLTAKLNQRTADDYNNRKDDELRVSLLLLRSCCAADAVH